MNNSNVLYIGPDYINHRGGIGAVLESYSKVFHQFKFIASYKDKGIIYNSLFFSFSVLRIIWLFISDQKIKIVHIHSASRGSFLRKSIVACLSKVFFKKVIFHIHGGEFHLFYDNGRFIRPYIRFILRLSNCIICLSPQWKQYFETLMPGMNIQIINNPVHLKDFSKTHIRSSNKIECLFLGKIGTNKGVFNLLEAISYLSIEEKEIIHLNVCGEGEVDKLNETIRFLNLEKIVTFKGWVNGDDKFELLRNSDLFALPSYNEGLPVSILEAMSASMAIISTPVGGIAEIVKHNVNGLLVNPGSVNELSEAFRFIIQNPELMKMFGKASKKMVLPYCSENVINSISKIYDSINEHTKSNKRLTKA